MTDQELKDIVAAVVAELEKSGVDFDYKAEPAEDGDLVFVIRGTAPNYQGVTVTWESLLDIITSQATQAKNDAVIAKNAANRILEQVQSNGTAISNFVATSKTEIETQKNESVNAVKSVYQTDLNELKGDINHLETDLIAISNGEDIVKNTEINLSMGIIHNTGRNPLNPLKSTNTAFSQYIDESCSIYFDDSKYMLLVIPYDNSDVSQNYGTWIKNSPAIGVVTTDAPHFAIELRKKDNSEFNISEIEFPYISIVMVENIVMRIASVAKEKSEKALTRIDELSKTKIDESSKFDTGILYGKTKKSISGLMSRRYKSFNIADFSELPLKDLLWDGYSFLPIIIDEYDFSASIIYVSPDGNGTGLTEDSPTTLINAISMAKTTQYSTIKLQKGIYTVSSQISFYNLSVKLVCDDGKAILVASSKNYDTWISTDKNCKCETIQGEISKVFEKIKDDYIMLYEVSSIDDCSTNSGSYYIDSDNSKLYVNPIYDFNNVIVTEKIGGAIVLVSIGSTYNFCNICCINVDFIGGASCFKSNANGFGLFKKCSFIGSYGYGNNCFSMTGNYKSVCIECVCKYSGSDGFNYKRNARFVEIDCVSGCHGYDEDSRSNSNGSTSHETTKGFRMGCVYYDTNGPVVADVGEAITVNSNCVAIESTCSKGNGGFIVDTATMYCIGCYTNMTGYGGYAQTSTGKIYSRNCDFDGTCNDVAIESIIN